jgi:hypothetical protein
MASLRLLVRASFAGSVGEALNPVPRSGARVNEQPRPAGSGPGHFARVRATRSADVERLSSRMALRTDLVAEARWISSQRPRRG